MADILATRLGIGSPIRLLVSEHVTSPAVVGFLKAVILLPASALTKLSQEDVEALLAHELAHVRRCDYLVNLLQSIVETVLFYHPAAWWISAVVRTEREHCCDDMALEVLGDREQFARALLGLEQLRRSTPRLAMAANRGPLLARIRRIMLHAQGRAIPASTWLTLLMALSISIGLAGTLHARQKTPKPSPSAANRIPRIDGKVIDAKGLATIDYAPVRGDIVFAVTDDHLVITRRTGHLIPLFVGRTPENATTTETEHTLVLEPAGAVEGTLTEGGKPVSRTRVDAYCFSEKERGGFGITDDKGHFEIQSVPVGDVILQASAWPRFNKPWSNPEVRTTIAAGSMQHVELEVGSGLPLKLHLVDSKRSPVAGADISVRDSEKHLMPQAGGMTDNSGEFECTVSPGAHQVTVARWVNERSQTVTVNEVGPHSITLQAPFDEKDARILCRLLDPDGKPVIERSVTIECLNLKNKLIKLYNVTDMYGKAIVMIPESRVKTMSASVKFEGFASDPKVRPINGVITIRLHRV